MYKPLTTSQQAELESMIDSTSLYDVLWSLERICLAKAEHVETNWQDKALARQWTYNAELIAKTARKTR